MTDPNCIFKDVPTADSPNYVVEKRDISSYLTRYRAPSRTDPSNKKRRVLENCCERLADNGLPGTDLADRYLYAKYIKNLSTHTFPALLPVYRG